jgi:hypothetical protein
VPSADGSVVEQDEVAQFRIQIRNAWVPEVGNHRLQREIEGLEGTPDILSNRPVQVPCRFLRTRPGITPEVKDDRPGEGTKAERGERAEQR